MTVETEGYHVTLHLPGDDIEVPGKVHPAAIPRRGDMVGLWRPDGAEAGEWVVTNVYWRIHLGRGGDREVSLTLDPAFAERST